jgi:glycosyltransferase involved in cell wall biosynthesis
VTRATNPRAERAAERSASAGSGARSCRRIGIDARKLGDGGVGRYVAALLSALPRISPEDEWVALVRDGEARTVRSAAPAWTVVPVRSKGYSLAEHFELGRVARDLELDLFHAPHYVLPLGVRCPVVVTVHDLVHWRLPRSWIHSLYCKRMLAAVRRRARITLVPSEAVAGDLVAIAGFDRARLRVVPNGLSAGFAAAPDETALGAFLRRLGVATPYVVNITNGLPHKGLETLLAALAPLEDLALVLAGRGSDRPAVGRKIRASGIDPSRVVVLGPVSERELRLAYRGATAAVVASRLEGFGLPALEAMASGVPVVVTDGGALPEVVGDAGIVIPAESVATLRTALYRIAFEIDPEERANLVQRGVERSRLFSWERAALATFAAYEQALSE